MTASADRSPSLHHGRIVREAPAGPGQPWRLKVGPADTEVVRQANGAFETSPEDELTGGPARTILRLGHITDFQHADLASPLRNDLLQKYRGHEYWNRMLPAYRPQEFLQWHALAAVIRTLRLMQDSPESAVDLIATTGDATDSAQTNELDEYLTLMNGGTVQPGRYNDELRSAPTFGSDPAFWLPESDVEDQWKREAGLPGIPGLRAVAAAAFDHEGLNVPWLACFGNHDQLIQGRASAGTPEQSQARVNAWLTGSRKPTGSREALPHDPSADAFDTYLLNPLTFTDGTSEHITPQSERRIARRRDYIRAHLDAPSALPGNGFTPENLASNQAYYIHDGFPGVRIITLDTTNTRGDVDGCLGAQQYAWLQRRLEEVHSEYRDTNGTTVRHEALNRVVIVLSHHGTTKLTNDFGYRDTDEPVYLANDIKRLFARFDNIVLWLNGHTHQNRIEPINQGLPETPQAGFWEITTGAIAEWPVQIRRLTLEATDDGKITLTTIMVDSCAPVMPQTALPTPGTPPAVLLCAAIHRWIAANDPGAVGGPEADGEPDHRATRLHGAIPPHTARDVIAALTQAPDSAARTETTVTPDAN